MSIAGSLAGTLAATLAGSSPAGLAAGLSGRQGGSESATDHWTPIFPVARWTQGPGRESTDALLPRCIHLERPVGDPEDLL